MRSSGDAKQSETSHLSGRVPRELHERLRSYARANDAQIVVVLILAISEFLDRHETS